MNSDQPQDQLLDSPGRTDLALPSEHKQALLREAMEGVSALPGSLLVMPSIWRRLRREPQPHLSVKFSRLETPIWPQCEFRMRGAERLTLSPAVKAAFGISDDAPYSTIFDDDSIYTELNRRLIAEFNWDSSMPPAVVALHSQQIVRERIARLTPAIEDANKPETLKFQLDEARWWLQAFERMQKAFERKD